LNAQILNVNAIDCDVCAARHFNTAGSYMYQCVLRLPVVQHYMWCTVFRISEYMYQLDITMNQRSKQSLSISFWFTL